MRVDASQVLAQGGIKIGKQGEDPNKQDAGTVVRRGAGAQGKQSAEDILKQSTEAAARQGQEVLTKQNAEAVTKQGTEDLIKSLREEGILVGGEEENEDTEKTKDADGEKGGGDGDKSAARERGDVYESRYARGRGDVREEHIARERENIRQDRESSAARERVDVREEHIARERENIRQERENSAARERNDIRDTREGSVARETRENSAARERDGVRENDVTREKGYVRESDAARERGDTQSVAGDAAAKSNVVGKSSAAPDSNLPPEKMNLVREFSDKSLAPYAAKLSELNMSVTESSARAMRELMAQYPRLSMDEAAFLASNKITGDESLMRAALDVLAGGDKTSAMISQIISALSEASGGQNVLAGPDLAAGDPKNIMGNPESGNNFHAGGSGGAPLSEFIAAIVKNASGLLTSASIPQSEVFQGDSSSSNNTQQIITQLDSNMQLNEEKIIDFIQKPVNEQIPGQGTAQPGSDGIAAVTVPGEGLPAGAAAGGVTGGMQVISGQGGGSANAAAALPGEAQASSGATAPGEAAQAQQSAQSAASPAAVLDDAQARVKANAQSPAGDPQAQSANRSLTNAVAGLLAEIPEFKGTPPAALERFSDMLLRIARDTTAGGEEKTAAEDVKSLAAQLEKMFTKIGRHDADAGARLREAREEMFARLTLVQEEISRASQPIRAEIHAQAQKLMDHVRLLNNIDQFVYMQLPVKLSEEEKTAELYVFKRKGGKKADPDNVNILLSIDLQFMGHWEAMLNIKGKNVYLNMEVAGEAEKEHFNANTVLLHQLLDEEGFKLMNTSIKISQEETTPLTALTALDRHTGIRTQGKIDFKI